MDLPDTYAALATPPDDADSWIIRELLSYDVLCPICCPFHDVGGGQLALHPRPLSPLYWSRQAEWPWAVREGKLASHHAVLDVGAGWSVLKFAVARRVAAVTCLELEEESITKARATVERLQVRNIDFVQGDACSLPFADESFDRVYCISVLEHIEHGRDQALAEMCRVLKPGGVLLLSCDVNVRGGGGSDYHFNCVEVEDLTRSLGIDHSTQEVEGVLAPLRGQAIISGSDNGALDGQHFFVVMLLRWVKPEVSCLVKV